MSQGSTKGVPIDIDGTLTNNSDVLVASQKAVKTYADTKAPLASPTFTGTVVLPSTTSIANVSATEIGYLDGVTSAIQTQLNTLNSRTSALSVYLYNNFS